MILRDPFSTMVFKESNSLKKMFELDENGCLKMSFRGRLEINTLNQIAVTGAIGHLVSLEMKGSNVSEMKIGESGTKAWALGGEMMEIQLIVLY